MLSTSACTRLGVPAGPGNQRSAWRGRSTRRPDASKRTRRAASRPQPPWRPVHDVVTAEHTTSGAKPPGSPSTRSTPPRWPNRAAIRRASPARTPAPVVTTRSTPSATAASTVGSCAVSTVGTLSTRSSAIPHSAAAESPQRDPRPTSPTQEPACEGPAASARAVDQAACPWHPTTVPRRKPPSGNTSASAEWTGSARSRASERGRTRSASPCATAARAACNASSDRSRRSLTSPV